MPKHVTLLDNGKYAVRVYSRAFKKAFHVGCYEFINDAISARDEWILKNPDRSKGCMPRGIYKLKEGYTANITFNDTSIYLGYFGTIEEAVKYRKEVLLGLL